MSDEPVEDDASGSDGAEAPDRDVDEATSDRSDGAPADPAARAADDDSDAAEDADRTGDRDRTAVESAERADDEAAEQAHDGSTDRTDDEAGRSPDGVEDVAADDGDDSATDVSATSDSTADEESAKEPVATHAPVDGAVPSGDASPDDPATGSRTAGDGGVGTFGGGIVSTPPDDEEMPLTEHIEEMLTRLAIVVVVAGLATLAAFPFAEDVIVQMWYDVHPGAADACRTTPDAEGCVAPHVYGPLELVLTRIRVAGLAGLVVALPLAVYQTYLFMRPGLYPHERRYYLAAVPFSLVLAVVGMTFAYFVLLPLLFTYFVTYTEGSAELAFQLSDTIGLILTMMGMLAIVFQIPLLIMLAIMMGITSRQWLERRRIYFWGFFLGVGFIFGPDPTGMAPVLLTATMVVLFEATLLLLRWTGR